MACNNCLITLLDLMLLLAFLSSATRLKQRFAFVKPAYGDRSAILDAARVADCLLLCVSIEESLGRYADHMLTCLFAQGLPSVAFCAQVSVTVICTVF